MYPQILSLIIHDKRFLLLDRDCSKRIDLFYYQSPKKQELLKMACKKGRLDIIKLLHRHIDISVDDNYCIRLATCYGHIEIVEFLLNIDIKKKVNQQTCMDTCIIIAAKFGYDKIIQILLSKSCANPSTYNNLPIQLAAGNGHIEVVKLLLSINVEFTANNNLALKWATKNGHLEVVKLLENWKKIE